MYLERGKGANRLRRAAGKVVAFSVLSEVLYYFNQGPRTFDKSVPQELNHIEALTMSLLTYQTERKPQDIRITNALLVSVFWIQYLSVSVLHQARHAEPVGYPAHPEQPESEEVDGSEGASAQIEVVGAQHAERDAQNVGFCQGFSGKGAGNHHLVLISGMD